MRTVLTIGSFDGVHLGHAALLHRSREIAGRHGRVLVLAFDPHPGTVLGSAPERLTTWTTRSDLLRRLGADDVIRLEPTEALLSLDPHHFVQTHIAPIGVTHIVEGSDFRFGRKRAGDTGVLAGLGQEYGFIVDVVQPVVCSLEDRSAVPVSSTLTRWLIGHGRVRDAHRVLGRPYTVEGTVTRGDRLGRTIGFPTVNIDPESSLPSTGVYAGWASLPDERVVPAAINIGERPTVNGKAMRLEAHLLDLPSPTPARPEISGLPEYGWRISASFISRLRDQVRFASVSDLQSQLSRDTHRARAVLSSHDRSVDAPSTSQG